MPYYDVLHNGLPFSKILKMKTLRRVVRQFSEHEDAATAVRRPHATVPARDLEMIVAYFAPMGSILKRIGAIAARGRARIIIPSKSDNPPTIDAARSTDARPPLGSRIPYSADQASFEVLAR